MKLLINQLEDSFKDQPLDKLCKLEFREVEMKPVSKPNDFNATDNILQELLKKIKNPLKYDLNLIMIDESRVSFETSDWMTYRNLNSSLFKKVQVIFNLKYDFDNMKIRMKRDENEEDPYDSDEGKIETFKNVLIGRLGTNNRCSNQIRNLAYYLLIHAPSIDNMHELKKFNHEQPSFDSAKPIWWETHDPQSFVDKAYHKLWPVSNEKVVLVYDRNLRDNDQCKVVETFCKSRKWKFQSKEEIVGAEFSTVIIFDLERFHFKAFTRCINHLIIVTTNATDTK